MLRLIQKSTLSLPTVFGFSHLNFFYNFYILSNRFSLFETKRAKSMHFRRYCCSPKNFLIKKEKTNAKKKKNENSCNENSVTGLLKFKNVKRRVEALGGVMKKEFGILLSILVLCKILNDKSVRRIEKSELECHSTCTSTPNPLSWD